jgi:hypothetical protein
MERIPFRGTPEDVIPRLNEFLTDLVDTPPVTRFCFGCSTYLSAARDRHDCSYVFSLFATENHDHAVLVENALSKTFCRHPNYVEDVAYDTVVGAPAGVCYVYLAVWLDRSDKQIVAV